jgi:hypothetical protein
MKPQQSQPFAPVSNTSNKEKTQWQEGNIAI